MGSLRTFVSLLASCVAIVGCRYEELNIGEIVPEFKFLVELQTPITPSHAYEIGNTLAEENDFVRPPPQGHGRVESIDIDAGRRQFVWTRISDSRRDHELHFAWDHDGAGKIDAIWVLRFHDSQDRFSIREWNEFAKWKDDVLPRTFPGATINVTRHPAVFTDPEKRLEFSRLSGVELPEKYVQ